MSDAITEDKAKNLIHENQRDYEREIAGPRHAENLMRLEELVEAFQELKATVMGKLSWASGVFWAFTAMVGFMTMVCSAAVAMCVWFEFFRGK